MYFKNHSPCILVYIDIIWPKPPYFCLWGFADAVFGKAYLLLLSLCSFLENFLDSTKKVDIHCTASRYFQKIVEFNACPRKWWNSQRFHYIIGLFSKELFVLVPYCFCFNFKKQTEIIDLDRFSKSFLLSNVFSNFFKKISQFIEHKFVLENIWNFFHQRLASQSSTELFQSCFLIYCLNNFS